MHRINLKRGEIVELDNRFAICFERASDNARAKLTLASLDNQPIPYRILPTDKFPAPYRTGAQKKPR